jgi:hypothetical protein
VAIVIARMQFAIVAAALVIGSSTPGPELRSSSATHRIAPRRK